MLHFLFGVVSLRFDPQPNTGLPSLNHFEKCPSVCRDVHLFIDSDLSTFGTSVVRTQPRDCFPIHAKRLEESECQRLKSVFECLVRPW
jgi:hypothetical protein